MFLPAVSREFVHEFLTRISHLAKIFTSETFRSRASPVNRVHVSKYSNQIYAGTDSERLANTKAG